jgi:hypothetical protein
MPSRRSVSACFNLGASGVARDRESSRSRSASTDAMSPDCGCVPGSLRQPATCVSRRTDTFGFDRRHAPETQTLSLRWLAAKREFSRSVRQSRPTARQRRCRAARSAPHRSRRSRRPSGRGSGSALRGSSTGARRAAESPTKSGCDPTLHRHGRARADSAQQPDRCRSCELSGGCWPQTRPPAP